MENQPQTNVGPAPDFLSDEAKTAWADLVAMAPPGKWLSCDSIMLELTATWLVRARNSRPTEQEVDCLADSLAMLLLGPKHFKKLMGIAYSKPWPDPNEN